MNGISTIFPILLCDSDQELLARLKGLADPDLVIKLENDHYLIIQISNDSFPNLPTIQQWANSHGYQHGYLKTVRAINYDLKEISGESGQLRRDVFDVIFRNHNLF